MNQASQYNFSLDFPRHSHLIQLKLYQPTKTAKTLCLCNTATVTTDNDITELVVKNSIKIKITKVILSQNHFLLIIPNFPYFIFFHSQLKTKMFEEL